MRGLIGSSHAALNESILFLFSCTSSFSSTISTPSSDSFSASAFIASASSDGWGLVKIVIAKKDGFQRGFKKSDILTVFEGITVIVIA